MEHPENIDLMKLIGCIERYRDMDHGCWKELDERYKKNGYLESEEWGDLWEYFGSFSAYEAVLSMIHRMHRGHEP